MHSNKIDKVSVNVHKAGGQLDYVNSLEQKMCFYCHGVFLFKDKTRM